jgi:hypothetical protein
LKSFLARPGTIAAGAIWLVVLWGAPRSFDFTDEGTYYLSAVHPAEVPDRQTTYFLFGRVLFALSGDNIIVTRALLSALLLAATWVFVRGLRRFLATFAAELDGGGCLAAAAVVGSALAFSIAPVAPSYNLLNAICLLAIAGLVLQGVSSPAGDAIASPRWAGMTPLLTGILLVADFFIKFSTSVALAALLMLFFLVTNRLRVRQKAKLLVGIALLAALAGAGYIFLVQGLAVWRGGIGGTLSALRRPDYVLEQLTRYWDGFQFQLIETLWTYESMFTALFVAGAALLVLRWWPTVQRWVALAGFAIAGYIGFQAAPGDLITTGGRTGLRFHLVVICALGLAAALTWVVRAPGPRPRLAKGSWRIIPAVLILALLPFAGSFGTSNDINDNLIYQLAPWLALIALLLAWLAHSWQARWLPAVGIIGVSVVTLGQFANGYIFHPYRVPGGRLAQTIRTSVGYPATTLRLDVGSHDLIEGARSQLRSKGFKPGDDIFAFFNLPGLVFALGGVSPGYPWYFSGDENSLALDAMRVNWVLALRRSQAFIILNRKPDAPPPPWSAMYMDFPQAYEPCGPPLLNPLTGETIEVWSPRKR